MMLLDKYSIKMLLTMRLDLAFTRQNQRTAWWTGDNQSNSNQHSERRKCSWKL